eukprot:jgi/Ulvmu1/4070/UM019_0048.1
MPKTNITIQIADPTDQLMPGGPGDEPEVDLIETPSNAELKENFEVALRKADLPGMNHAIHSFSALKSGTVDGVDQQHKERHLTRDEFVSVFGLKPEEFELLPHDAQEKLKVDIGLGNST